MTEKERVKRCIRFEKTDLQPWQINFTTELARKVVDARGIERPEHTVLGRNVYEYNGLDDFCGNHIAYIRNRAVDSFVEVRPGVYRDEWGVQWDRRIDKDIGVPVNCVLEDMRLEKLETPDPHDPARFAHFEPIVRAHARRYLLVRFSYSLFERAWSLRGMTNLMMDLIGNPSFVHELMRAITDYHLDLLDRLGRYPIDGVLFGDDYGGQRGLLINPVMWRAFIKPYLKEMFDRAHAGGYDVFIHSCGNVSLILDDLVEIGLNVFNPFQPEVVDVEKLIKQYAGRLAFYGGLSIQKTLPFGSIADVRAEVMHRLGLARVYGGYIISPSHEMPPDIPLANVLVMVEVLRNQ
jgi:uroporphyrinogen decarboxylase